MRTDGVVIPSGLWRIEQYTGPWATEPSRLRSALASVDRMDLRQHAATYEAPGKLGEFRWDGDTAVIDVLGSITKYGSSLSGMAYGTIGVRKAIRRAVADPNAKRILMVFDSPGGTVAGVDDLAEEVRKAAKSKPVLAYCEDLCASAAYWVASQATEVYANRSAVVGSIGVYMLVYDDSEAAAKEGVKAHLIKTSEFKGAGAPGLPVTDEQVSEWQRQINGVHAQFRQAVMRGRKLSAEQFEAVATGQVWEAKEALKLGLIDGVVAYDQLVAKTGKRALVVTPNRGTAARSAAMSYGEDSGAMTVAAYVNKLKAACPGADADWLLSKAMGNASIEDAMAEHYTRVGAELQQARATIDTLVESNVELTSANEAQATEIERLRKENTELNEKVDGFEARLARLENGAAPLEAVTGNTGLESATAPGASAMAQVEALTAKRVALTGESRQEAWRVVMASNPELKDRLIREATVQRAKIKRD